MFFQRSRSPISVDLPPLQIFQVDINDVHGHEASLANLRVQNRFYGSLTSLADPKASIAANGERVLGYVFTTHQERRSRQPSVMMVNELCVDIGYRKHNLGAALMHHALQTWGEGKTEKIELISRTFAKPFYQKLGFLPASFAAGAMSADVSQIGPVLEQRAATVLQSPDTIVTA